MINLKKIILSCFLLWAFTSIAQNHYEIFKPIDSINSILTKNSTVFFVENGEMIRDIRKFQGNQYGRIIIVNTAIRNGSLPFLVWVCKNQKKTS